MANIKKLYDYQQLDLDDLHYLLNLLHTITNEVSLRERFVDTEFDPKLNRSTILRCKYKLELFLKTSRLKPKILDKPTMHGDKAKLLAELKEYSKAKK